MAQRKIGDTRLYLAIIKEVLLHLEAAEEIRALTPRELQLHQQLKARGTGLATIEKSRIRQRSRLVFIQNGDANTIFFHIRASTSMRKNYVHYLDTNGGLQ